KDGKSYFAKNTNELFLPSSSFSVPSPPKALSIQHLPDFEKWTQNIYKAQKAMKEKKLDKVVLARKTRLDFQKKPSDYYLVSQLLKKRNHSFFFYFAPDEHTSFIGISPERLYRR